MILEATQQHHVLLIHSSRHTNVSDHHEPDELPLAVTKDSVQRPVDICNNMSVSASRRPERTLP